MDLLRKQGRLIRRSQIFLIVGFVFLLSGCEFRYGPDLPPPTIRPVKFGTGLPAAVIRPSVVQAVERVGPAGWVPASQVEDKRRWRGIMIHHSYDPSSGMAADIDVIHRARGMDGKQNLDRSSSAPASSTW